MNYCPERVSRCIIMIIILKIIEIFVWRKVDKDLLMRWNPFLKGAVQKQGRCHYSVSTLQGGMTTIDMPI